MQYEYVLFCKIKKCAMSVFVYVKNIKTMFFFDFSINFLLILIIWWEFVIKIGENRYF